MKRGNALILAAPARRPPADLDRPGPGGSMLFMDDGQQRGLLPRVSHWNMGRRLLDLVRPLGRTKSLKTLPDPGADEMVRRWYVASSAFMIRTRRIESSHFNRALELSRRSRGAVLSAVEPMLQYYANVFLGGEFEALGNGEEARRSYERAAALAPTAQSPLLGLSRVAEVVGDRATAREAVARALKLPAHDFARPDPWWVYELAQGRHVDRLLAELRQGF